MSKLPRFINVSVPDYYGVMHTLDWMRADIANDLLEALEKLEEYADGFSVSCVYLNEETEGKRLLMKARAAIAKAKGEQE